MKTIDAALAESCRTFADKDALRHKVAGEWKDVSYRELWRRVEAGASGLHRWGARNGDRIAILAPSSPQWVVAYLAVLRCGAIAVPIDKDLKSGELRHILEDCGARLLFTAPSYLETVRDMAAELPSLEKVVLLSGASPEEVGAMQIVEELDTEWRRLAVKFALPAGETLPLERMTEALRRALASRGSFAEPEVSSTRTGRDGALSPEPFDAFAASGPAPPSRRQTHETAVILYTSGTTGRSKGAMLSHANILSNIDATVARFRVDHTMRTLSFLPINHVYEQVCGILLPLRVGGTVSFAESLKKLGQNLAEVRPNFLLGVPAVYRMLVERIAKSLDESPLSRTLYAFPLTRPLVARKIRQRFGGNPVFISGGAALDPAVGVELRRMGITIYQGYGITETSPVISFECPGESRLGSVGRPLSGVEVKIEEANDEGIGEILVRGPNVMQGYYGNPEATAEVLEGGWYRTGDLGRFDPEGYLYICGRKKNLIVTPNGKNVYPEEVELELLKSPFIAEVMVYGHKTGTAEEVHAIIYPNHEALDAWAEEKKLRPLGEKQVEEIVRREVLEAGRRLADYKRVKKFTLREDEFPKTTTRKIKRFAMQADISAERG